MTDRYEAHKLHYLTRAAEVMRYDNLSPSETAQYALATPGCWKTLHSVARYIAEHEPPPDPNEALRPLVDQVEKATWGGTRITLCFTLIDRMRAEGLLKEGV